MGARGGIFNAASSDVLETNALSVAAAAITTTDFTRRNRSCSIRALWSTRLLWSARLGC